MLIHITAYYLKSHKRLVIPQLGAFIVKEQGQGIVFSELLNRDDGVLRGLLCAEGMGEVEAAGEIDRFVFEVRHTIGLGEEYCLEGLGTLHPGLNGTIAFAYDPQTSASLPDEKKTQSIAPEASASQQAEITGRGEPYVSPSVKLNPEPCLKGLRYGKPVKNTHAYTFVDNVSKRRGPDRFLLVAVIAAVVAVAAIAFGYYRASQQEKTTVEQTHTETPQPEQP